MNLDNEVPDIESMTIQLEGIGAQRLRSDGLAEHGSQWTFMANPEEIEFCICDGGTSAS
jgi:hypothetical protein